MDIDRLILALAFKMELEGIIVTKICKDLGCIKRHDVSGDNGDIFHLEIQIIDS
jgi:hypothetical protein